VTASGEAPERQRYARRLTAQEVQGIIRLRDRKSPADIAHRYGITVPRVGRILRGDTYRDVTHLPGPHRCQCPSCTTAGIADDNVALVRAMTVTVPCAYCTGPAETTVARVLGDHGVVGCAQCDRRRRR
jgi:hypothetical protein